MFAFLLAATVSFAGNVWDGGGGDDNFGTGANWDPDGAPSPGSGNDLTFAGTTRLTPFNNYTAWDDWRNWTFTNTAGSFNISGNQVDFFGKIENRSTNAQTVRISDFSFNNSSAELDPTDGDLWIGGGGFIYNNGNDINVWGNNNKTLHIDKEITHGGKLRNRQTNIIAIYRAQTYTGNTELDAGELHFASNGSIAVNSRLFIGNGGTTNVPVTVLILNPSGGSTQSHTNNINNGNYNRTLGGRNTSGTNTFAGPIIDSGSGNHSIVLTANTGGFVRFTGVISVGTGAAAGDVFKIGAGTVALNGDNSYSGRTIISNGILRIDSANRLPDLTAMTIDSGAAFDMSNNNETVGSIAGAGSITQGTAQLIVGQNDSSTEFSGIISGSGSFVKKGSGRLILSGANTVSGNTFPVGGTLQWNANQGSGYGGVINLGETTGSAPATISIGASGVTITNRIVVRANDSAVKYITATNTSGTATFSGNVQLSNDVTIAAASGGNLVFSGRITNDLGRPWFTNTAGSTIFITNGGIHGANGVLKFGPGTLVYAAPVSYSSNTFVIGGTLLINSNGTSTFTNTITLGPTSGDPSGDSTLAIGVGGVVVTNPINIRAGNTGTRAIAASNSSGTAITRGTNIVMNTNLTLKSENAGALLAISNIIGMVSNYLTLYVTGAGDVRIAGAITNAGRVSGDGALYKSGSGTLTLLADSGGSQGLTGDVTIAAGTVLLGNGNALGDINVANRAVFYSNNTTIASDSGTARTMPKRNVIHGTVTLGQQSGGTGRLTLSGNVNLTAGDRTIVVSNPLSVISGIITNGGFTKSGAGNLRLDGVNIYTGATVVSQGTLIFIGSSVSSVVTAAQGGNVAGTNVVGALVINNGGTNSPGTNTSVATFNPRALTLNTNGVYAWEITNATGTAGVNWDLISVSNGTGDVTVNAGSGGNEFIIDISTRGLTTLDNFNNQTNMSWLIIDAGAVSGFGADKFTVRTNNFLADTANGTFNVSISGGDIYLNFRTTNSPTLASSPATLEFGATRGENPSPQFQTFYVTNIGGGVMAYSNQVLYDVQDNTWLSVAPATGLLTSLQSQTHTATVTSASLAVGTYKATNVIHAGEAGTNTVVVTLIITNKPTIGVDTNTIFITNMLGNASTVIFGVTNTGHGVLSYSNIVAYGDGASGWFTVRTPTTGSLAAAASRSHTADVATASITNGAGTYIATNLVLSSVATNSPQVLRISLLVTNIPPPQSVVANTDGAEMIRLSWAEAAGRTVMIVHRAGSPPSVAPTNGVAYNAGDPLGGGTVIWKSIGSSTASNLEHIVAAGSVNYYRLYTVNNDAYSLPVETNLTTMSYRPGEIVDQFAYTNTVNPHGVGGGQGWTNTWNVSLGTASVETNYGTSTVPFFPPAPATPTQYANRVRFSDPGNGGTTRMARAFAPITSGVVYVSARIAYEFRGPYKWAGISIMSNNAQTAFFGKIANANNNELGIAPTDNNNAEAMGSGSNILPYAGTGGNTGNVYVLMAKYNFDDRRFQIKAFHRDTLVPTNEPAWDLTSNMPPGRITVINGVRLTSGALGAGDGTIGQTYFDEVRVATNWPELMQNNATFPYATNLTVNSSTNVSDAQMTGGNYRLVMHLRDVFGIETASTTDPFFRPHYDIFNANGALVVTNFAFTNFTYIDFGRTVIGTNLTQPSVAPAANTLGTNVVRWSAANSNGTFTWDSDKLTDYYFVGFEGASETKTGYASNDVTLSGISWALDQTLIGTSSDDVRYGARSMRMRHLSTNAAAAVMQTNKNGGVGLISFTYARFGTDTGVTVAVEYSADNGSTWILPPGGVFNSRLVLTNTPYSVPINQTGAVRIRFRTTAADTSGARVNIDDITLTDFPSTQRMEFVVFDDDTSAPSITSFFVNGIPGVNTIRVSEVISGGWSITGLVSDAFSGINVNGSVTSDGDNNISPYFTIVNSTGTTIIAAQIFTNRPADGGGLTAAALGNLFVTNTVAAASAPTGTYTAYIVVADNDEDRLLDRIVTTSSFTFVVIEVADAFPQARDRTATNNPTSRTLGDQFIPLGADTDTSFQGGDRTNVQIWMRYENRDLLSHTSVVYGANRNPGVASVDAYAIAPQFTATGDWFWAMAVTYDAAFSTKTGTVYEENFNAYSAGSTNGTGTPPYWTTEIGSSSGTGTIATAGGQLRANNVTNAFWLSRIFNISYYTNVSVSLDLGTGGSATHTTANYIRVSYTTNGGSSFVTITNWGGQGSALNTVTGQFADTTVNITNIVGTAMQVRVEFAGSSNGRYYSLDNVTVRGMGATYFYRTNTATYTDMFPVAPTQTALKVAVTNIPNTPFMQATNVLGTSLYLNWSRPGYDVMIVQRLFSAPDRPTDGTAYTNNQIYGVSNIVIRSATSTTNIQVTGLVPGTVYVFGFFSENYSYYSTGTYLTVTTRLAVVDGNPEEWIGTQPTVVNSSTISSNEFIWRDKEYEQRTDHGFETGPDDVNNDIWDFRVKADANDVYFYVRMQNINNFARPYIAIGVDVDQDPEDTAMNFVGDDSDTSLGSQYFSNNIAALHYPERQIIVHNIDGVGQRIELFAGGVWYSPPTHGDQQTAWSSANDIMEFRIARTDLLLSGNVTGRFTVASFQNGQIWANDGDSTTNIPGGSDGLDTLSIAPHGSNDFNLGMGARSEDLADNDVDFYFDVRFVTNGLGSNQLPTTPVVTFPTNNATVEAGSNSLNFTWNAASDPDDTVTSYFFEWSTNANFNGGSSTENGTVLRRINTQHTNLSLAMNTNFSLSGATQFYWRVRARDLGGMLSGWTTNSFQIVPDDDEEGPQPYLVYVGTNYSFGLVKTNITDAELANVGDAIDIAVGWTDPSGVFTTNASPPNTNILEHFGRIVPNWDLYTTNIVTGVVSNYGFDREFTLFNGFSGAGAVTTAYANAFNVTNIDFNNLFFLTISAEDNDNDRGTYPPPVVPTDPVPFDRKLTINYPLQFSVVDDDPNPPVPGGEVLKILLGNTQIATNVTLATNLLAYWSFNDTNTLAAHLSVTFGTGVMTGTSATNITDNAGSTANSFSTNAAGRDLTIQGITNIGRHIQFRIDMTGYRGLVMTYAGQRSGTGYDTNSYSYSTDGVNFTHFGGVVLPGSFAVQTADFSSVSAINNQSSVYIRITFGTNTATGAGNNRFDNFQFNARDLYYEIYDSELATVTAANPLHFSFNVYDSYSGIKRGNTFDGTNMYVNISGIATNNTAAWSPPATSSVDTTISTSTSLWSFTSFSYNRIGDLYATGVSNRPVLATIADADADRLDDSAFVSNRLFGWVRIIDDDTNAPEHAITSMKTPPGWDSQTITNWFFLYTNQWNAFLIGSGTQSTNRLFQITDGFLANMGGEVGDLQIHFGAWDTNSGLARTNNPAATTANYSRIHIANWFTDNITNFAYNLGSTNPVISINQATSVWRFTTPLDGATIQAMMDAGSNRISATFVDGDDDRPNDGAALPTDRQFGWLSVIDDDTNRPIVTNLAASGTGSGLTYIGDLVFFDFDDADGVFEATAERVLQRLSTTGLSVNVSPPVTGVAGNPGQAATDSGWFNINTNFFYFTLTVEAGFQMSVTNITFMNQRSGTGPTNWYVRYSGDGFASDLGAGLTTATTAWGTNIVPVNLSGLTGDTTFRIGAFNPAATAGTWRIDNLLLQGSVSPAPGSGVVSDQDLNQGTLLLTGLVFDADSGVYSNKHASLGTTFDLISPSGATLYASQPFTNGPASNGAARGLFVGLQVSNLTVAFNDIVLGVHTAFVYATDFDEDRTGDRLSVTQRHTFTVIDDDTNRPTHNRLFSQNSPMQVFYGNTPSPDGSDGNTGTGTNRQWRISDNEMLNANTTNVHLHFGVYDASGYYRTNTAGGSNMLVTITNYIVNNFTNYNNARSSANVINNTNATSVWTFAAFTGSQIQNLVGTTSRVTATITDMDFDRPNDQLAVTNLQFGFVAWLDNDRTAPGLQLTMGGTNIAALELWRGGNPGISNAYAGTNVWEDPIDRTGLVNSNQIFRLSDADLRQIAATNPLMFNIRSFDSGNANILGIQRGTSRTETNSNHVFTDYVMTNSHLTVGSAIVSNTANFRADLSSSLGITRIAAQFPTNYWVYTNAFATNEVDVFWNEPGQSNQITFHAFDADNDRPEDQANALLYAGWLVIHDDDPYGPTAPGTVLYDPFNDGDRTDGADPLDVNWYIQGTNLTLAMTNDRPPGLNASNALRVVAANGGPAIVGVMGSSVMLTNENEQIVFSFIFRLTNAANHDSGFRFGIHHDAGTAVSADGAPGDSNNDVGYVVRLATGTNDGARIYREAGTDGFILRDSDLTQLTNAAAFNLNEAANHAMDLVLTRVTNGVLIELIHNATNLVSIVDTNATPYTNFNQVAFGIPPSDLTFIVDEVSVAKSSVRAANPEWTNNPSVLVQWTTNNVVDPVSGVLGFQVTTNGARPTSITNGVFVGMVTQATVNITLEGLATNYLFGLDGDGDRTFDQGRGVPLRFLTKLDFTAPTNVPLISITNGPDDQSEFVVTWSNVPNAGIRASDGDPLSPWHSYRLYYTESSSGPTTNDQYISVENGGDTNLALITTTNAVFSNFLAGTTYRMAMAGVDKAGNIGRFSQTAVVETVNFIVTQGLARVYAPAAPQEVEIYWKASANRGYDMIFADTLSYGNHTTNMWAFLGRVTNNWLNDTGATDRTPPSQLNNTMRFYRVAQQNTWQITNTPRKASREIYAARAYQLKPGENWWSFSAIPDTATVAYVFGTNRLPTGPNQALATKISWYGASTQSSGGLVYTNLVWLSSSGWKREDLSNANDMLMPVGQAFNIELVATNPARTLVIVGQVPTVAVVRVNAIQGNTSTNIYNPLGYVVPRRMRMDELGLKGIGLKTGPNVGFSDEIRILDNSEGAGTLRAPKARLFLGTDGIFKRVIGVSVVNADNYIVEPDEALFIIRRSGETIPAWTNRVYYDAPGNNINP